MKKKWKTHNPSGSHRVIVTKPLIGDCWLKILTETDCRVDVCSSPELLTKKEILTAFGESCEGAIGQLTETWDRSVFAKFKSLGGRVYSNVAVGYDNVDVAAATKLGIRVANTPGVLTETTAELTVALTFAVARSIAGADSYTRTGKFKGWKLDLMLGDLLRGKTLGVIGMGRIGTAYARMMAEGHRMNVLYIDPSPNESLEDSLGMFNDYLHSWGEQAIRFRRSGTLDELLQESDVVSLHPNLNESSHHLIDGRRLAQMKKNAILINVSRGSVIDEKALVVHCRKNPEFKVGLDVYEKEPKLADGLAKLKNVTLLPHIGSATYWTREAMSTIAACNVAAILSGYPVWQGEDIQVFLRENPPKSAPSIVNERLLAL